MPRRPLASGFPRLLSTRLLQSRMKRLILFCDGTLEDADTQKDLDLYTNIGRLSRAVKELDERECAYSASFSAIPKPN